MKHITRVILISLSTIIFVMLLIILRLYLIRGYDLKLQTKHNKSLDDYYDDQYQMIDENTFLNFDVTNNDLNLNEIQYLASHNSYKKKGPAIGKFFVGLGDSFDEANALKYGYKNFTDQLESGIRSFEIDIRYRKDTFELTHVPLVDPSSQAVNFELLLDELMLFSTNQEHHIPIIILVEIKTDWMMLDPSLQDIKTDELKLLDEILKDKLKDRLFSPSDMVSDQEILRDKIMNEGWPSVSELLNKFIFILHPGTFEQIYYEIDENLQSQSMFIGSSYQEEYPSYASFFVHNDVDINVIKSLVDDQFMVRTRIDSNLVFSIDRYQDAMSSGAQILTTDFSIARSDLDDIDVIYLENDKTIIQKDET